ncbi:hypothetical protein CVV68_18055 [Arthrobacter livingstonensis]|uniref:Uncharacterized protein n=1 Tax=Arthrobacter livingstonensis TaxID=670078 RepID=A0A2V5L5L7_9MICC|nr:hypothetical protein CVV68_18055 [Arthrobacter livingstonensis]
MYLALYSAFQARLIAKRLRIPFHLSAEVIAGMNKQVVLHSGDCRGFDVIQSTIEPPADADDETRLLRTVRFWVL